MIGKLVHLKIDNRNYAIWKTENNKKKLTKSHDLRNFIKRFNSCVMESQKEKEESGTEKIF